MKICLIAFALYNLSTLSSANTADAFAEKIADLGNGAEVVLNIINPPDNNSTFYLDSGSDKYYVPLKASAHVDVGEPDVHYIYIMDTSGSTSASDGDCGSTLQCIEEMFYKIHHKITGEKSAKAMSLIEFDTVATIVKEREDPSSPEVGMSLLDPSIWSGGGTYCGGALRKAMELVKDDEKTVIIFAGDGMCDHQSTFDHDGPTLEEDVAAVENKEVIVHTIAVGDNINCTGNSIDEYYQQGAGQIFSNLTLSNLTTNGGVCFDIPDPNETDDIVEELTKATLSAFKMKIDDGDYVDIPTDDLSDLLPQDSPSVVTYTKQMGLDIGEHDICFLAIGSDTSGDAEVEDCRRVSIQDMPTASPSQSPSAAPSIAPSSAPTEQARKLSVGGVVGIVFGIIVGVTCAVFWQAKRQQSKKEADTMDGSSSTSTAIKKEEVVETGVPVQVI